MTRIPVPPVEPACNRNAPSLPCRPSAAARLLLLPLAALAAVAQAIGLGEISQQSALGAPLRVVVPVLAGTVEELAGECVRIVPAQRGGDGIPDVRDARIALERTAAGARIVVISSRPVGEPVLKLTLQAGCDSVVRREYVLLMDPVPIDAPVARESGPPREAAAGAPAGTPATAAGTAFTPALAATGAPPTAPVPRAPARRRAAAASAAGASAAAPSAPAPRAAPARAARTPPAPPRAAAPATPPKLTVSTAAPAPEAQGPGRRPDALAPGGTPLSATGATAAPADASAALDAEAAALQQRVVDLTAMVDRMQQEMRSAEALQAAQGARAAAGNAAKASPQATLERWRSEGWPLLVAVVALAVMIAALLSFRRRRAAAASGTWRMEAPSQGRTDVSAVASAARPAPIAAAAPPKAAAAAPTRPQVTAAPAAASTVDVSELSHVTEEAGVYLAFNRPDRAIDVLREHIHATPRSLPAAWLMLLDLYRTQGREQEFRELADQFHRQFNAQTPAWDAYRPQAQDDRGLEAFPHLVAQLTPLWGKPACREFLDHLLHENRDGRRTGFSLTAYEDILFLRQLADVADGMATRAAPGAAARGAAPSSRPAAPGAAPAPVAATPRRPTTRDLELALDEDMLAAGKSRSPGAAAPPAKDPPKNR